MSETKHDGGPAFPPTVHPDCHDGRGMPTGLSIRDWFAGQAIIAVARMVLRDQSPFEKEEVSGFYKRRAIWAYEMADAMLAERANTKVAK